MEKRKFRKFIFILTGVIGIGAIFAFCYLSNSKVKIVLVGVDGATWDVMNPLIEQGKLPNIKRLMDKGAYGNLESIEPMLSPALWTTIATGKSFEKHGIKSFTVTPPGFKKQMPVTSNLRRTKAIWNILTDRRKKSIVINYYVTYPPEEINGTMISRLDYSPEHSYRKHLSYYKQLNYPYMTYPASVEPIVCNLVTQAITNLNLTGVHKELADLLILEKVTLNFIDQQWDFFTTYTRSTDEAGHLYWKYMEPDKFEDKRWGVLEEDIERYGGRIEEIYIEADNFIGKMLSKIDKDTITIIVSDHGMRAASQFKPKCSMDSGVHDINGIIIISGRNIKANHIIKNASVLDITPTILFLLGLPVGKDMDGEVLTEAIAPLCRFLHPIKYVETYDADWKKDKAEEPVASPFDKQIIERLKSLGYLQ